MRELGAAGGTSSHACLVLASFRMPSTASETSPLLCQRPAHANLLYIVTFRTELRDACQVESQQQQPIVREGKFWQHIACDQLPKVLSEAVWAVTWSNLTSLSVSHDGCRLLVTVPVLHLEEQKRWVQQRAWYDELYTSCLSTGIVCAGASARISLLSPEGLVTVVIRVVDQLELHIGVG